MLEYSTNSSHPRSSDYYQQPEASDSQAVGFDSVPVARSFQIRSEATSGKAG